MGAREAASLAGAALLALGAGLAWYLFAARLLARLEVGEATVPLAVLVAAGVAVQVGRWARTDRIADALAEGRCPRCGADIVVEHAHAGAAPAWTQWRCACGFERTEPLTCQQCEIG